MNYNEYQDSLGAYMAANPIPNNGIDYSVPLTDRAGTAAQNQDQLDMDAQYQGWLNTLTPAQQQEYNQVVGEHYDAAVQKSRITFAVAVATMGIGGALAAAEAGSVLAPTAEELATIGADAGTSAAWGSGAGLGGDTLGAIGASEAAGAGAVGEASMGDWMLGAEGTPISGAEYAGLGGEVPFTPPEVGNEADWYNNPDGTPMSPEEYTKVAEEAFKPVTPPTGNEADWYNNPDGTPMSPEDYIKVADEALTPGMPSLPKLPSIPKVPDTGGSAGGGINLGSLLGGAGIGAAALAAINGISNSQDLPAIPDYMKLAEQTAADKTRATNEQTLANRPNQTNAQGDTSQWVQDPVTGVWTQKIAFGAPQQAKFDETNAMLAALRGQINTGIGKPLDMSVFQAPAAATSGYGDVDLSTLQPAGYTPMGSSQVMQDILRTK